MTLLDNNDHVLNTTSFRTLLAYTQKAHFKSSHMQKLHLALSVYRGLGTNPSTRTDTLTKVISMLLHPFPKVNKDPVEKNQPRHRLSSSF